MLLYRLSGVHKLLKSPENYSLGNSNEQIKPIKGIIKRCASLSNKPTDPRKRFLRFESEPNHKISLPVLNFVAGRFADTLLKRNNDEKQTSPTERLDEDSVRLIAIEIEKQLQKKHGFETNEYSRYARRFNFIFGTSTNLFYKKILSKSITPEQLAELPFEQICYERTIDISHSRKQITEGIELRTSAQFPRLASSLDGSDKKREAISRRLEESDLVKFESKTKSLANTYNVYHQQSKRINNSESFDKLKLLNSSPLIVPTFEIDSTKVLTNYSTKQTEQYKKVQKEEELPKEIEAKLNSNTHFEIENKILQESIIAISPPYLPPYSPSYSPPPPPLSMVYFGMSMNVEEEKITLENSIKTNTSKEKKKSRSKKRKSRPVIVQEGCSPISSSDDERKGEVVLDKKIYYNSRVDISNAIINGLSILAHDRNFNRINSYSDFETNLIGLSTASEGKVTMSTNQIITSPTGSRLSLSNSVSCQSSDSYQPDCRSWSPVLFISNSKWDNLRNDYDVLREKKGHRYAYKQYKHKQNKQKLSINNFMPYYGNSHNSFSRFDRKKDDYS